MALARKWHQRCVSVANLRPSIRLCPSNRNPSRLQITATGAIVRVARTRLVDRSRSNPHSARGTAPSLPRFPPLEVFVRRPPKYVAPSSWGRHPKTFTKPDIGFTNFLHRWRPFLAVSAECFDWQSRHVELIVRCRRPVRFLVRALRRRISNSEYSTVWSWIEAASPDQLNLARFGGRRWIALTARARVSLRRIEHAEGSTTVYFSPTMPRQRLVPMQARLEAGACLCVK